MTSRSKAQIALRSHRVAWLRSHIAEFALNPRQVDRDAVNAGLYPLTVKGLGAVQCGLLKLSDSEGILKEFYGRRKLK